MKKSNVTFQTTPYSVKPVSTPIDYFKLPVTQLVGDGYSATEEVIDLQPDEYLSIEAHLSSLDDETENTTVFNIQTGKGKTTACYSLVERYVAKGYTVIVLSPFIKLVEKDYPALQAKGLDVFSYKQLGGKPISSFDLLQHDVHVMTINCLLKNPGEDAYEQAAIKQGYLESVMENCKVTNTKIVMFFDELHESIQNFHAEFFPNLARWESLIHKCFVASATFTPASVPALKYIAYLTSGNIHIYDIPRVQIGEPVSLSLHMVKESYSGKNIAPLSYLKDLILSNEGKKINILVGHKSIITGLMDTNDVTAPDLVSAVMTLNPNVVTSGTTNPFDIARNNIGTNFKTGIDIQDTNSLFIVIMPCIKDGMGEYGIFSDGLPSIVQSMARLRRGGEVHVFMLEPSTIIDKSFQTGHLFQTILKDKNESLRTPQSTFYNLLEDGYVRRKAKVQATLFDIDNAQYAHGLKIEYRYPVFSEYLTEKSQNQLVHNHFEWGKELSPFVIWAGMNNQFTNGVVKEVTITSRRRMKVVIGKSNVVAQLKALIPLVELVKLQTISFDKALHFLISILSHDANGTPYSFEYNTKPHSIQVMATQTFFMQALINIYIGERTNGSLSHLSKQDYILSKTLTAGTSNVRMINDEETLAYYMLSRYRKLFLVQIQLHLVTNSKGEKLIHKDTYLKIWAQYVPYFLTAIERVQQSDPLLKRKVYAFYPTIINGASFNVKREVVYKVLEKCFLDITSIKKSFNGQKDEFYLVGQSFIRSLPSGLTNVSLF